MTCAEKHTRWTHGVDELFQPDVIFVEQSAASYPLTARILERCPGVPVVPVEDSASLIKRLQR
jgi:hypothetical protein